MTKVEDESAAFDDIVLDSTPGGLVVISKNESQLHYFNGLGRQESNNSVLKSISLFAHAYNIKKRDYLGLLTSVVVGCFFKQYRVRVLVRISF